MSPALMALLPKEIASRDCYGGVMRTVTPPSLKWLVVRRARLLARAKQLQKLADAGRRRSNEYDAEQEQVRRDIAALDHVLSLHEIRIDPEIIQPKKTQENSRLLPWNHLTRSILTCLRQANGEWCSTTQIVVFVAAKAMREIDETTHSVLRLNVRSRLRKLRIAGRVVRRHKGNTGYEGYWALPPAEALSPDS